MKRKGGDVFIVDNSDTDWKVRDYLREWTEISHSFDTAHYQKIVAALSVTIRLMAEIDKVIDRHGGWPGAFATSASGKV